MGNTCIECLKGDCEISKIIISSDDLNLRKLNKLIPDICKNFTEDNDYVRKF